MATNLCVCKLYFSKVADELLAGRQAKPESFINISMLFANIVDFSRIIYKSSPEEVMCIQIHKCLTIID